MRDEISELIRAVKISRNFIKRVLESDVNKPLHQAAKVALSEVEKRLATHRTNSMRGLEDCELAKWKAWASEALALVNRVTMSDVSIKLGIAASELSAKFPGGEDG